MKKNQEMKAILIIDPDNISAERIQKIFSDLNYSVDSVNAGQPGILRSKMCQYELIIINMDFSADLINISAVQVIREIRHWERIINQESSAIIGLVSVINHNKEKLATHSLTFVEMQGVFAKPMTVELAHYIIERFVENKEWTRLIDIVKFNSSKIIDVEQAARQLKGSIQAAKEMIISLGETLDKKKDWIHDVYTHHQMQSADNNNTPSDQTDFYLMIHGLMGSLNFCGTPRLHAVMRVLENFLLSPERYKKTKCTIIYKNFQSQVSLFQTELKKYLG